MNKKIKLLAIIFSISISAFSQYNVIGLVLNEETLLPVSNAHISIFGKESGTTSNPDGSFMLRTSDKNVFIEFTSIGYKNTGVTYVANSPSSDLGIIYMQPQPYSLNEISINA